MGKTVRFKFPCTSSSSSSSSTTTSSSGPNSTIPVISGSTYSLISPQASLLTNCFLSINNHKNNNNKNYKMFNGNGDGKKNSNKNNYSRLLSSSSSSLPSTSRVTTTAETNTSINNNYNSIYPSTALEDQPTSSTTQNSNNEIYIDERHDDESNLLEGDTSGTSSRNGAAGPSAGNGICEADDNDDTVTAGRYHRNGERADEEHHNSRNNLSSANTIDYDSMTEVVIDDLNETEPTSAILDFCKRKFLRLYLNLLGFFGIYPTSSDTTCPKLFFSYLQTVIILLILCFGYFLQWRSSFRRDRGFSLNSSTILTSTVEFSPYYKEALDYGDILFVHIIPSGLHLLGFIFGVYVFRVADNEQLQNLVERVFLLSNRPKKLCIILWIHVASGFIVLSMFTAYVVLLVYSETEDLQLGLFIVPGMNVHSASRIALIVTTFAQDAIQMTILTAYCIECYLLSLHLRNLKEKLMQHKIETIDWMREILEFRKLLNHLNKKVALPVSFFIIMNLLYSFAGLIYVFKEYDFNCPLKIFLLNFGNVILWLIIGLLPFFYASNVTGGCKSTQYSGHYIRVRPFVYHNTPSSDLDSTLLFASSLNMSAKLFRMPIQTNYLCFSILLISFIILTLGMCLNITLGLYSN